ncbi:MAG: CvpA family protein [Campylobacterota bacterium]|nr:CvpA family protein [Campylobacterota bacterium]
MENINIFDIIVLSLVALLGLKGLFRGFTKEFFGLVGIVGGVFIASRVATDMGNFINGIIPMENENSILLAGFVLSLVLFWIIAYVLGTILEKVFCLSGLGFFDRLLGFLFGASKIFLLFSIIAYAVTQVKSINDNLAPKMVDSIVFPILEETGGYIIKLDTSNFQSEVSKQLDGVIETTTDTIKDISTDELKNQAAQLQEQLKETTSEK